VSFQEELRKAHAAHREDAWQQRQDGAEREAAGLSADTRLQEAATRLQERAQAQSLERGDPNRDRYGNELAKAIATMRGERDKHHDRGMGR
jgi:hypothetical protein